MKCIHILYLKRRNMPLRVPSLERSWYMEKHKPLLPSPLLFPNSSYDGDFLRAVQAAHWYSVPYETLRQCIAGNIAQALRLWMLLARNSAGNLLAYRPQKLSSDELFKFQYVRVSWTWLWRNPFLDVVPWTFSRCPAFSVHLKWEGPLISAADHTSFFLPYCEFLHLNQTA